MPEPAPTPETEPAALGPLGDATFGSSAAGRPGPFMTTMRTDREVIVRLNILLGYTLTDERRQTVEQVLKEAAERLGGRITLWDLLYTDVPVWPAGEGASS